MSAPSAGTRRWQRLSPNSNAEPSSCTCAAARRSGARLPPVADIVVLVKRELRDWADAALLAGVKRERIVLDPGFGFGKNFEQNYPLLRRFDELHQLRYPLLAGVSRKSFVGRMLARNGTDPSVSDRLYGTLATETVAS